MSQIISLVGIISLVFTNLPNFGKLFPHPKDQGSNSQAIIEQIEKKTVPAQGNSSVLGLKFDMTSYNQLVNDANIHLSLDKADDFRDFNVLMPCCGFQKTVAKFEDNCQCGHHLASYGLIKKMLISGESRQDIQKEVNNWIAYFFPKDAIAEELKSRNLYDSRMKNELKKYKTKGGC